MSIDSEFPKNDKIIEKHKNEDGRFHFVWGPGRHAFHCLYLSNKYNLYLSIYRSE